MALRSGHGLGRGVPRVEVLPPDELPPATQTDAVAPERGPDGRFLPSNTVGRSKRLRPGVRGTASLDLADDAYKPFAAWGRRYASHRRRELAQAHGGSISAGVGALVESASMALAASRFLMHKGSASGDAATLKTASQLANDARQNELAAWELAARECRARPTVDAMTALRRRLAAASEPDATPAPEPDVDGKEEALQ